MSSLGDGPGVVALGTVLACMAVTMLPITAYSDHEPVVRGRNELAARPARYAVRRWRVLVVDRNALVGELVRRMLKAHDIATVRSEATALAALALDADVDAILCSLTAPEMSGLAFADVLSERYPRLRSRLVFMLGAASPPELLARLALTGVPWIVKPLRYAPLVTQIGMVSDANRSRGGDAGGDFHGADGASVGAGARRG